MGVEGARRRLEGDRRVEEFLGVDERNEEGEEEEQAAHVWSVAKGEFRYLICPDLQSGESHGQD